MNNKQYKTYGDTFIYSIKRNGGNIAEQSLLEYIMKSNRIDKSSEAFKPILDAIRTRQTTAVLYRVLLMDDVVLGIYTKELPSSFKVFTATDVRSSNKSKKTFIDLTGLVKLENGYFSCKEIDKLCAYLLSTLVNLIYYSEPSRIYTNAQLIRSTTTSYIKLFTGIIDYLRIINYSDNKTIISYIIAVYYLYNLMSKDIGYARSTATNILGLKSKDTSAYDLYYDPEKDFINIDTFIKFLSETFKLKELTTDVFIDRWIYLYGKGTMYGSELLPAYLTMMTNAYSGAYINNQRKIETCCGRDMITISTILLQIGVDIFNKGFKYNK